MTTKKPKRRVRVRGMLPKGAWHTGGRINQGEELLVSAEDAKILLDRGHVERVIRRNVK